MTSNPPPAASPTIAPPTSASQQQPVVTTVEAYAALVKKHRTSQDAKRVEATKAFKNLQEVTEKSVTGLVQQSSDRAKAGELIVEERRVDEGVRALHAASVGTQKRLAQWGHMFVNFQNALKDLGDLSNWSQAVESDVKDAVNILDAVVKHKANVVAGKV